MVRIESTYEGDLHTSCRHEPSGTALETDAPKDNQGRGESFSPTDLVAAALASCTLTVMGIVARRRGWTLEGARATVDKQMVADPVRRVARLDVHLAMPAGLPPESHAVLERTARACPVAHSLHPDLRVEIGFDWAE